MKRRLQAWLEARWWSDAPVPAWLAGLSRLFAAVATRRRRRQQARSQRLPVPVIVVGNITVGGSGKTPVVIALVEALQAAGYRPGVISRGYGSSGRGVREVPADGDPALFGDEPVLIARRTGVPVVVDRDRVAAGRALIEGHGVDVVIADDGLQHYRLARDFEIAVVDGCRRFGNGRLLPGGPLRELPSRLQEVDAVLVNGPRQSHEDGFDLVLTQARALDGGGTRPLSDFSGSKVHAVAGIGDPTRFFAALRAVGIDLIEHPFPDHHDFAAADLCFGDDWPLLMTEKDAVKCTRFARPGWHAVPATAQLPPSVLARLLVKLGQSR